MHNEGVRAAALRMCRVVRHGCRPGCMKQDRAANRTLSVGFASLRHPGRRKHRSNKQIAPATGRATVSTVITTSSTCAAGLECRGRAHPSNKLGFAGSPSSRRAETVKSQFCQKPICLSEKAIFDQTHRRPDGLRFGEPLPKPPLARRMVACHNRLSDRTSGLRRRFC
jgi:hypothetical protein